MSDTNKLAQFFDKQRELIEAAETPFMKFAVFILPILAPMVPATFTGMHLYQLFLEIFTFANNNIFAGFSAILPAIVLELLGYVGAISFIRSLFRWIEGRNGNDGDKYLVPAALDLGAYIFYLSAMWLINVNLGNYFGTDPIVNNIVGLLSFVTVPTSLLAANHLAMKESDEMTSNIRQENMDFKLKKQMIKQGLNPFQTYQSSTPDAVSRKEAKKGDWRVLSKEEKDEILYVLTVEQIMEKYHVGRSTAFSWKSKK